MVTHNTGKFRFCSVFRYSGGTRVDVTKVFLFPFHFLFTRYFPFQNELTLFLWNILFFIFQKFLTFWSIAELTSTLIMAYTRKDRAIYPLFASFKVLAELGNDVTGVN